MKGLIVIPCFNESARIEKLLLELEKQKHSFDVLVIDDGSKDKTQDIARKYVKTIRLTANLGIGGAVQTGIKYAKMFNYDFCIQMDGDGQHPPDQLPALVAAFNSNEKPNLVIGSRFLNKEGFQSHYFRRIGIRIIRFFIWLATGKHISDPTSGYRLMDKSVINLYSKDYPQDYPEPISLINILTTGLKIKEIPVVMLERTTGKSSIGGLNNLNYMIRVISYIILYRIWRTK